jgi:fructose-bisphosphate aldolase class II
LSLVNMQDLLDRADQGGYAVGAFNVANMEMVLGIIKAGEALRAPLILQIAERRLNCSPLHLIGPLMVSAARQAAVPVAVHFDHGLTMAGIQAALEIGFTSVMIDGSHLPLAENIRLTQQVMAEARRYHAAVEAEIGVVGNNNDESGETAAGVADRQKYSDPEEVVAFYREAPVAALAVAIGNAHGVYAQEPNLNFDILNEIHQRVAAPLVLHGGTGLGAAAFRSGIRYGIRKINVATANFIAVADQVRQLYESQGETDYFQLQAAEIEGACRSAERHIQIFGCANQV